MPSLLPVRVARRWQLAQDIVGLALVGLDEEPLPTFSAGAHVILHWAGFSRPYSLCHPCADGGPYVVAVQREATGRGGSRSLHDSLLEGDHLHVGGPASGFALVPGAAPVRLIGGGIGITPLLCMAGELTRAGRAFELAYLARSRRHMAFLDELSALCGEALHLHADDEAGAPADLRRLVGRPVPGGHLYVCGPAGLIDSVQSIAADQGWAPGSVHAERFSAPAHETPALERPFDVLLARSGARVHVPAGVTVVAALRQSGVEVPVSCEQGACGVCLSTVVDGVPLHRDCVLTDTERAANTLFLPCCSRAVTPTLTLDL